MSDVEVQMLTKADDYPIHQTPEPVAYAGLGRNFYDRYFFNGYHKEENLFFRKTTLSSVEGRRTVSWENENCFC